MSGFTWVLLGALFFLHLAACQSPNQPYQAYSKPYCKPPNYRVIGVPLPGFFEPGPIVAGKPPTYVGFHVDLLNEMARVGGFTYTLQVSAPADFGHQLPDGCFNGAVGELIAYKADIVLGALESTLPYSTAIDFTTAYLQSNVHLLYNARTGLPGAYKDVKYAVLANTATRDYLERSKNPQLQAIWANIAANQPASLPQSYEEALNLVKQGGWAFFGRTPAIDNAVAASNGLLVKDYKVFRKDFAGYGTHLGSPVRHKLNLIINQLQDEGTVDALLARWFPNSDFACS